MSDTEFTAAKNFKGEKQMKIDRQYLSEPEELHGKWCVWEELRPERRGERPHIFDTEAEALTFYQTGEKS